MAKEKKKSNVKGVDNSCGVKKEGDAFFCTECGSKITEYHDCPNCGRNINWGTALSDLRRIGPSTF